jgi:trehalose/maltose hydrolase-like predicted phosphorylase
VNLPAAPTLDPAWLLVEEGFQPARERDIESLMTVANGYVGTRGSLAEGTAMSRPATFIAGAFDQAPASGVTPGLVVAPDWTRLGVAIDGTNLSADAGEVLLHRRVLDLYQAILWREWRHRDPAGRLTQLRFLRLASQADRHLLIQSVAITPENYSGRVSVELPLSRPSVIGGSLALAEDGAASMLTFPFGESSTLALASTSAVLNGSAQGLARTAQLRPEGINQRWEWDAAVGQTVRLDRVVAIATSRDADPVALAQQHLDQALIAGVDKLVAQHIQAWEARWRAVELELVGDAAAQRALRVAAYHLIAAANPDDERVSIGARALTGDAYKGHVFWDAEIYVLPFLTFTWPEAARALLLYRFHTLPAARAKAHRLGYRGALFAWESTDTGEETTPQAVLSPKGTVIPVLTGELAHHISADIAYGVWQYWQATRDDAFFHKAGAEIMLETARFYASRGCVESDGRFHIRNVIGPDEYHEGVDDNAYTNTMAAWNLKCGAETAELLAFFGPTTGSA